MSPRSIRSMLDNMRALLRRTVAPLEEIAAGQEPAATPLRGAAPEWKRETSTNAQTSGASVQPWSGNRRS